MKKIRSENTFNEQNFEINQKQQLKIEGNGKNSDNSESEENRPPLEPPPSNSKSTRQILMSKNVVECHNQSTIWKTLEKRGNLPKFKNLQKGTAKEIKKGNYYHFALPIEEEAKDNLSETLKNTKLSIYSLHELSQKLNLRSISI